MRQHFPSKAWKDLPKVEKEKHGLRNCTACQIYHGSITSIFPAKDTTSKSLNQATNENVILTTNGTTAREVGKQIINKVGPVEQRKFGKSVQEVLVQTPLSKLDIKKNSEERRKEKRGILKDYKKDIETHYNEHGGKFVMQNRVSWRLFNKMRKEHLAEEGIPAAEKQTGHTEHKGDQNKPQAAKFHFQCSLQSVTTNKFQAKILMTVNCCLVQRLYRHHHRFDTKLTNCHNL